MEARFDAKLDIIRRVEEARAPVVQTDAYDDSDEDDDEEDEEEEEEEEGEEGEEESTADDASFARSEDEVKGMLSPTPASRLANVRLNDQAEGEDEDDELAAEVETSSISIDASAAGDVSVISLSGDDTDADGESSIIEHSFVSQDDEAEEDEDEADEDDAFAVSKPVAGAKAEKKPKRKLGGKVTDAEAIEAAVESY